MAARQLNILLIQSLERERDNVAMYLAALDCTEERELRREWHGCLARARQRAAVLEDLSRRVGMEGLLAHAPANDPEMSLLHAVLEMRHSADRPSAELVAAECVLLAQTQGRLDWELLIEAALAAGDAFRGSVLESLRAETDAQPLPELRRTRRLCASGI